LGMASVLTQLYDPADPRVLRMPANLGLSALNSLSEFDEPHRLLILTSLGQSYRCTQQRGIGAIQCCSDFPHASDEVRRWRIGVSIFVHKHRPLWRLKQSGKGKHIPGPRRRDAPHLSEFDLKEIMEGAGCHNSMAAHSVRTLTRTRRKLCSAICS
jgi:hypothetical protein